MELQRVSCCVPSQQKVVVFCFPNAVGAYSAFCGGCPVALCKGAALGGFPPLAFDTSPRCNALCKCVAPLCTSKSQNTPQASAANPGARIPPWQCLARIRPRNGRWQSFAGRLLRRLLRQGCCTTQKRRALGRGC